MNEWIVLPGRDIQSIYSKPWAFLKKLFWPFKKIFSFNYGFKKNTHTWNLTVFTIVKCYIVGRQISRTLTSCNRGGNGIPLQYSCLENPMDGGAWCPAVHGVAKSRAWLSDFTFTFHFHVLEKEIAVHSSVLAWRIPGMGEPGGLPSMGSHRVGHDWSQVAAAQRHLSQNWNSALPKGR